MISRRIGFLFVVVMLMIVAASPAAHAQTTVGTITQLTGTVTIQRAGATIGGAPNMPILLHDQIVTGPNSSMTIGMIDNSSLQLGASSTLSIDESVLVNGVGAPSKVGLLGGDLHSVILGAMRGGTTTFQVNTPNAIGAVRGTDWNTHYDTENHNGCFQSTKVDVNDGTVHVCNTATPPECKDLTAGQHTEVRCGAFWLGTAPAGIGGLIGATALGVGAAAGIGVGVAAGTGAFNGPGSPPPPPSSPSK